MTEFALLPCPFCGGRASIVDVGGVRAVECDECCAAIYDDPEYACAAWNRRTSAGEQGMSDIIQRVGEKIGDHMDEIVRLFKPGAKITVIVRQPSVPDHSQDLILTSDDLDSAIAALERRKNPVGTNEARV